MMIKVWTPFKQWFIVKNPKKIEWWKKLAIKHPHIIIKKVKDKND